MKLSSISRRNYPLTYAFALSLAVHLLLFGVASMGVFKTLTQPHRVPEPTETPDLSKPVEDKPRPKLQFVEVPAEVATDEAPEDADYYSAANSRAADSSPEKTESNKPEIKGEQDKMAKTRNVVKAESTPASSSKKAVRQVPERPTAQETAKTEPRERRSQEPVEPEIPDLKPGLGDLAMARSSREVGSQPSPAPKRLPSERSGSDSAQRPRTIEEALTRKGAIEGRRMKQQGGVQREGEAALDVKATTYGAYDKAMVAAIQQHWYNLLGDYSYASDAHGRVVISFRLHQDGRVTQAKVVKSNVSTVLSIFCQRAIEAPAPYREWPSDMTQVIGQTHRDLRFAFFYN